MCSSYFTAVLQHHLPFSSVTASQPALQEAEGHRSVSELLPRKSRAVAGSNESDRWGCHVCALRRAVPPRSSIPEVLRGIGIFVLSSGDRHGSHVVLSTRPEPGMLLCASWHS